MEEHIVIYSNTERGLQLQVIFWGWTPDKIEKYLNESFVEPPVGKSLKSQIWTEFKMVK